MGMGEKDTKHTKKGWSRKGTSCMLHEPSMTRPCMEGYLYVGRPVSSKER